MRNHEFYSIKLLIQAIFFSFFSCNFNAGINFPSQKIIEVNSLQDIYVLEKNLNRIIKVNENYDILCSWTPSQLSNFNLSANLIQSFTAKELFVYVALNNAPIILKFDRNLTLVGVLNPKNFSSSFSSFDLSEKGDILAIENFTGNVFYSKINDLNFTENKQLSLICKTFSASNIKYLSYNKIIFWNDANFLISTFNGNIQFKSQKFERIKSLCFDNLIVCILDNKTLTSILFSDNYAQTVNKKVISLPLSLEAIAFHSKELIGLSENKIIKIKIEM